MCVPRLNALFPPPPTANSGTRTSKPVGVGLSAVQPTRSTVMAPSPICLLNMTSSAFRIPHPPKRCAPRRSRSARSSRRVMPKIRNGFGGGRVITWRPSQAIVRVLQLKSGTGRRPNSIHAGSLPMIKRIGVALGLLLLCAVSIVRVARPPRPVSATAPDTVFSAERAMRHVEQIAQRPHPMGTADHYRVRDYIVGQLSALGLTPQIQQATALGTRYQEAGHVQNILARLPGHDPNGKAVLVMAHYDGVEAGPAASDDGAGCAALLETLHALRATRRPLAHDIIALFTDGEEAGLLGAAAFVREHPWAKDIGVVLNFEARGTSGRSFMFETGPGNLDAARALRSAGDATAGSVYATIYRTLPNDTDLSELAVLDLPALNFAFADGVERYHTSHDDVAHLNRGSLQHNGSQMLAMTRTFGAEPLPRAHTGDGVFFDLPIIGLVVYPQGLELPLAILALGLVLTLIVRGRKEVVTGVLTALAALALSGGVGWAVGRMLSGPAVWSGLYATGIVLLALAV